MSGNAQSTNGANDATSAIPTLPAIAAAFLVRFDDRKGYTIAWQEKIEEVDIDGVVEYKSMPSGLHNVKEDLVYFVHEDYAGISAVLNVEDTSASRNARVIAVGVLVPLEHGRMGKSWLHAEQLKKLAEKQIKKKDDYTLCEEYWNNYKISKSPEPEEISTSPKKEDLTIDTNVDSNSNGYRTYRSMSMGISNTFTDFMLPAHHPALVLPEFLRLFGPLIFPLVRAALLRKRILILGEAPVERTCDYVYNLSVLSSLPKPIISILPDVEATKIRLRPLFNVGVSDISFLESESKSSNGWIACTTDDVICTKPDLFDVLVILPDILPEQNKTRVYPKMYFSSPELSQARPKHGLRASQRDAKRFATLWKGLQSIPRSNKTVKKPADSSAIASSSESASDLQTGTDGVETASIVSSASSTISLKAVVEPQSWSQIAYTSLVWWASAGDTRSGLAEMEENENEQDVALLTGQYLDEDDDGVDDQARTREVSCVQYFQRLSNLIFTAVGDAIRRQDGYKNRYRDEEENEPSGEDEQTQNSEEDSRRLLPQSAPQADEEEKVEITQEDIQQMGLDIWSQTDKQFVEEFVSIWWKREADVQSGRIECCGLRIL